MSPGGSRVIVLPMGELRLVRLLLAGLASLGLVACGSRTGLLVPSDETVVPVDASVPIADAALPPLDVVVTPPPSACADAGSTLIYVITESNALLSFDPLSLLFHTIGAVACPTTGACSAGPGLPVAPTPYSMAVDRTGIAYVVFCDGELFRVSTANAVCRATPFRAPAIFTPTFGMGFSQDENDPAETLYVASTADPSAGGIPTLGTIQTTDFQLAVVAPFEPPVLKPELTGTGGGDLFAFLATGDGGSSAIGQLDKTTAQITGEAELPGLDRGEGWAFAFWGGDFYTFTAPPPAGTTIVTRFHPSTGARETIASLADIVVGAGVSTCAPQQ